MKIGCFTAPAGQDDSPNKDRKCQRQACACLCVSRSVLTWPPCHSKQKHSQCLHFRSPWTCPVLSVSGVRSRFCLKLHHLVMSGPNLCPSAFCHTVKSSVFFSYTSYTVFLSSGSLCFSCLNTLWVANQISPLHFLLPTHQLMQKYYSVEVLISYPEPQQPCYKWTSW